MNKKKILIITISICLILFLIIVAGAKKIPVQIASVKQKQISSYVEERAKTTLPRIYHITMPLDGQIEAISLKPGTHVKKGQTIAKMDTADLKTAVAEAQARLDSAQSQIKVNGFNLLEETALKESKAWIDSMNSAVEATRKKAEASLAQEKYAKWWLDSSEDLYSKEATSLQNLKEARSEHVQIQVTHQADQFVYHSAKSFSEVSKLLPTYIKQYLERKSIVREVLASEAAAAEAALNQAIRNLEKATMTSPIDGVILKRYHKDIQVLPAGENLLDIGNLENLEVTANILSDEVVGIKPDNLVEIYGPAVGTKPVHGKVVRINPQGFTKISSLGVEQQRVPVIISINQDDLTMLLDSERKLGVEYRVQVRIYTATHKNSLTVPRTSLFRGSSGQWELFVVKRGKIRLVNVEVGLTNDKEAEITKGLRIGDIIVIAPDSTLTNGTKVKYDK